MNKHMTIDKSVFTAEEREQYEALIAKAKVNPEAAAEKMEEDAPADAPKKKPEEEVEEMEKSAGLPEFVTAAIQKSEEFIARAEKQEMTEVAKKYELLGEKPEELGEKLYNLKKSDPAMYETCISMLDKQVQMVEKTGIFAEIGKTAGGYSAAGGAQSKVEAKAAEIMKADPSIDQVSAIAKAWEDPTIMAEYDSEFYR